MLIIKKKTYIIKINININFIIIDEVYSNKIVLNTVAYADNAENTLYSRMADDFNKYAEENNLDIAINMKTFTSYSNFTDQKSFAIAVEQLLKKKNNKYDLYYFDNAYTPKYGKYLLNLKDYLQEDL